MINKVDELLHMIETASPDDKNILGEIDARVWCYLNDITYDKPIYFEHKIRGHTLRGHRTEELGDISTWNTPTDKNGKWTEWKFPRSTYSSSRNALVNIRPPNSFGSLRFGLEGSNICDCMCRTDTDYFFSIPKLLPSECLAELHSIMQLWKQIKDNVILP